MALVKFGGGITEMRGSIGGTTFSRNRYGAIARNRTKPVNPNTAGQAAVRAAMAALVARWAQTLTALQRTAWNLYGTSVAMLNGLGETVYLTGFNHYVRSNLELMRQYQSSIDPGPVVFELPEQDPAFAVTGSEATQVLSVTFDNTLDWAVEAGAVMWVYQGSPQNPQRNFFAGPWKYLGFVASVDPGGPVSPQDFPVVTAIAELQRQWIYGRVRRADGRLSTPFRCDAFVGA